MIRFLTRIGLTNLADEQVSRYSLLPKNAQLREIDKLFLGLSLVLCLSSISLLGLLPSLHEGPETDSDSGTQWAELGNRLHSIESTLLAIQNNPTTTLPPDLLQEGFAEVAALRQSTARLHNDLEAIRREYNHLSASYVRRQDLLAESTAHIRDSLESIRRENAELSSDYAQVEGLLEDISQRLFEVEARTILVKYAVTQPLGLAAIQTSEGVETYTSDETREFLNDAEEAIQKGRAGAGGGGTIRNASYSPNLVDCVGAPTNCLGIGWNLPSDQTIRIDAIFQDDYLANSNLFDQSEAIKVRHILMVRSTPLCAAITTATRHLPAWFGRASEGSYAAWSRFFSVTIAFKNPT